MALGLYSKLLFEVPGRVIHPMDAMTTGYTRLTALPRFSRSIELRLDIALQHLQTIEDLRFHGFYPTTQGYPGLSLPEITGTSLA